MSCLDFVLVSKSLEPYIESVVIDSSMKYAPVRPLSKEKSVASDHFPILVTFVDKFVTKCTKRTQNFATHTIWNTNKEGGGNVIKN